MDCGHTFCSNCWSEHFIVKINEVRVGGLGTWHTMQCNAICDEGVVRNLVRESKPELAEKFDCFLLKSYIEDNKMVKWCPRIPCCGNAIHIMDDAFCEVECTCGLQFCFRCISEGMLVWQMWSKKSNESKIFKWIAVYKIFPNLW